MLSIRAFGRRGLWKAFAHMQFHERAQINVHYVEGFVGYFNSFLPLWPQHMRRYWLLMGKFNVLSNFVFKKMPGTVWIKAIFPNPNWFFFATYVLIECELMNVV